MAKVVSGFSRTRAVIAVGLVASVLVAGAIVRAQQRSSPATTSALTPQDYIDIQQLVSSYAYGLDGNTDNGATYASLFAPGGVFGRPRTEGRDNLAALANTRAAWRELRPPLHYQSRHRAVARRRDRPRVRRHHRHQRER